MPAMLDLAYVRFCVNDIDAMQGFLLDFGLTLVKREANALFMATADGQPFAYAAHSGDQNTLLAIGVNVASRSELEELVSRGLASKIDTLDAPGGGLVAHVEGPDGIHFEVVAERDNHRAAPVREPLSYNCGVHKARRNGSQRPPKGMATAMRLGHCALRVSNARAAAAWLEKTFGMRVSDYLVVPGNELAVVGAFMCCDRGETFVDHHTLFVSESPRPGLHHYSFEVQDMDAVMSAHDWLLSRGYQLDVGVGRHMAGSQVFDYWIDPTGFRTEHYSDGDVVNHAWTAGRIAGDPKGVTQWGPVPPEHFFE